MHVLPRVGSVVDVKVDWTGLIAVGGGNAGKAIPVAINKASATIQQIRYKKFSTLFPLLDRALLDALLPLHDS